MPPTPTLSSFGFPKPGPGLRAVLLGLFSVWLTLALAINFGGADPALFFALTGNVDDILHGQLWRLLTAPLVHVPTGSLRHILGALLGLYFLSPSLEQSWGTRRFLGFLGLSALSAYLVQLLFVLAWPSLGQRLVPAHWFGAMPVVSAISIAWALHFKARTLHLMMVLPITGKTLLWLTVGFNLLAVIALEDAPHGRLAPFGAMLAGWLLGGGTPSPLRRWWLQRKLRRLDAQARREAQERRRAASHLRVVQGGKAPPRSDDEEPGPWLN